MASENEINITLAVDGMYYREAHRVRNFAVVKHNEFMESDSRVTGTKDDILKLLNESSRNNDDEDDPELDQLSGALDQHWEPAALAATELIRLASTAHMLCAASLEAHINIRAEQVLSNREFDEFDKLGLSGKWLFYPILTAIGRFDPGAQPFQGFQQLIKRRNALVHYKVKRAKTYDPYEIPPIVKELGLTVPALDQSLATVRRMISELAKMEGRTAPDWLGNDPFSVFEYKWVEDT